MSLQKPKPKPKTTINFPKALEDQYLKRAGRLKPAPISITQKMHCLGTVNFTQLTCLTLTPPKTTTNFLKALGDQYLKRAGMVPTDFLTEFVFHSFLGGFVMVLVTIALL